MSAICDVAHDDSDKEDDNIQDSICKDMQNYRGFEGSFMGSSDHHACETVDTSDLFCNKDLL
jgi:hypothetical protein